MTTATRTRCIHCRSPYIFHPSFYGGEEVNHPYNHERYCPSCYEVVVRALAAVQPKYEKRFLPTDQYSRDQIVEHQDQRCAVGLNVRRIMPGLYDMTGRRRHCLVCERMPDGEWYKAEWWTDEPNVVQVTRETWCEINPGTS